MVYEGEPGESLKPRIMVTLLTALVSGEFNYSYESARRVCLGHKYDWDEIEPVVKEILSNFPSYAVGICGHDGRIFENYPQSRTR